MVPTLMGTGVDTAGISDRQLRKGITEESDISGCILGNHLFTKPLLLVSQGKRVGTRGEVTGHMVP